jgi:hypothetical protein
LAVAAAGGPAPLTKSVNTDGLTQSITSAVPPSGAADWTWAAWQKTDTGSLDNTDVHIEWSDGTLNNRILIYHVSALAPAKLFVAAGGVTQVSNAALNNWGSTGLWEFNGLRWDQSAGQFEFSYDGAAWAAAGGAGVTFPSGIDRVVYSSSNTPGFSGPLRWGLDWRTTTTISDAAMAGYKADPQTWPDVEHVHKFGDGDTGVTYLDSGSVGTDTLTGVNSPTIVTDYPTAAP